MLLRDRHVNVMLLRDRHVNVMLLRDRHVNVCADGKEEYEEDELDHDTRGAPRLCQRILELHIHLRSVGVKGLGVWGLGVCIPLGVLTSGFRVLRFRLCFALGFGVRGSGSRAPFRDSGVGFSQANTHRHGHTQGRDERDVIDTVG
jgi:hypothetical protein